MKFKKTMIGLATVAGLVFAAGAHAQDVVIYSGNNTAVIEKAAAILKEKLPNLDVAFVRGKTGALLKRMEAEAKSPLSDVFWTGGFATLGAYKQLLASYDSPGAKGQPANLIGPDNLWAAGNVHVMVIMINERQLKGMTPPKTWSDLFDPKWKGKVVMGDPTRSSSTYAQLYGLFKIFGPEGVKKLAANVINTKSTSSVYKGVAAGEYPVGITMEYSAFQYLDGGQKEIKLVYPTEGTFLSPEGLSIVKGAKHLANAKKVFDVLASAECQKKLFKQSYRRPAHPGVDVNAMFGLPKMDDIKIIHFDQLQAAADRPDILKQWKKIIKEVR